MRRHLFALAIISVTAALCGQFSGPIGGGPTPGGYVGGFFSGSTGEAVRIDAGPDSGVHPDAGFSDAGFPDSGVHPDAGFPDAGFAAPTLTITSPTSDPTYNTCSSSITIGGTTTNHVDSVAYSIPDAGSGSCTNDDDAGTFSCASVPLNDGVQIVTVTATGPGGSGGDTLEVTYTAPPTVTITSPSSDPTANVNTSTVTVSGTTTGTVTSTSYVNSAGGSGACTTGSGTVTCSSLSLSATSLNGITVTATNSCASGNDLITIRRTPPGSPVMWFAADNIDDQNNSTLANNDPVASWEDQGSYDEDVSQGTGSSRPTYLATCDSGKLNNKPCVSFDGGDFLSVTSANTISQANLICIITRHNTTGNMIDVDGAGLSTRHLVGVTTANHYINAGTSLSGGAASANAYKTVCGTFNGGSSTIRVDGSSTGGNAGSNSFQGIFLGQTYAGSVRLTGRLLEVVVYDTAPTGGAADVESYWTDKYGAFPQ